MSQTELQIQPPPTPQDPPTLSSILQTTFKILSFRATPADYNALSPNHLIFGLICTWIVGIGRWWDDPEATPFKMTGLGSVAYVFFLSAVLWFFSKPIAPKHVTYLKTLTFVTLTAPPAILYAIPVEKLTGNETALNLNIAFLIIVAAWRVAMYCRFLCVGLQMNWIRTYAALFSPISLFLLVLTWLSLMNLALRHMGGLRAVQTIDGIDTDVRVYLPPPEPANTIADWLTGVGVPFAFFSLVVWLGVVIYTLFSTHTSASTSPEKPA